MQQFESSTSTAGKQWLAEANAAAKKVGPGFTIAKSDMAWAGGQAWQGVQKCYNNPPCKAAVEKYGMMAVKVGMTAAMAQQ